MHDNLLSCDLSRKQSLTHSRKLLPHAFIWCHDCQPSCAGCAGAAVAAPSPVAVTDVLGAKDAPHVAAVGGSHETAQAQSELEANTAELEHAVDNTPPVLGDDEKAIYRELAGPLADDDDPDIPQPESSSSASARVGAEAPTPAETAQPSAQVVDLSEQAVEMGPPRDPVPDEGSSPSTAAEETVVGQPASGVEDVTLATDAASAAAAAPDTVLDTTSEPAPSHSEQADAVAPAAGAPSEETAAADAADTVAAPHGPVAVALPEEDTLLDDSTVPAPATEADAAPEAAETASAAADEEVARNREEVTERPPIDTGSSNVHAEDQEVAEPAAAVDMAGAGEIAATGAASGEAARAEPAATTEAAAPAAASEVTAAAEGEPTVLSLGEDEAAEAAAPEEASEVTAAAEAPVTLPLGQDAAARPAAADDKDDAVVAKPVIALATGHPSAGTFTDSHGSQGEDEFHDATDENSKAVSPAGGSPAASE